MAMLAARPTRDLVIVPFCGSMLALACDSAGGVGDQPADAVAAPGEVVGRFTARVALAEILSVGATPLLASASCCVDPRCAASLLAGVRAELTEAGCPELPIAISTEQNLPTVQTGIGVTIVGAMACPWARARAGDALFVLGVPKVGRAVRLGDPEIADLPLLRRVLPQVRAIVPAGSRGVWHEALVLAAEAGLEAVAGEAVPAGSAGPATALVAAAPSAPTGTLALRQIGWLR